MRIPALFTRPRQPRRCLRPACRATYLPAERLESRTFLSAGDLDPSFGQGGIIFPSGFSTPVESMAGAVAFAPGGKLVVAGNADSGAAVAVARYNPDGSLDPTFDADGTTTAAIRFGTDVTAAVVQPDGKVVVAGTTGNGQEVLFARFNADGSPDATFDGDGVATTVIADVSTVVRDLEVLPDGRLLATGGNRRYWLARLNADGSFDDTFGIGGVSVVNVTPGTPDVEDNAHALVVQGDGKVVVAGAAAPTRAVGHGALVRWNLDATRDAGFGTVTATAAGIVHTTLPQGYHGLYALLLLPDGKIAAAGSGSGGFVLMHFNADGSPDATFGAGGTVFTPFASDPGPVSAEFMADGRIVVAGADPAASNSILVMRFAADGLPDATFGIAGTTTITRAGLPARVADLKVAPDGTVAIATRTGDSLPNASGPFTAVVLAPSGQLDSGFGGGVLTASFRLPAHVKLDAVAVADDRRIIAAGSLGGDLLVARFNPDGTFDSSFQAQGWRTVTRPGESIFATDVIARPDGRILIAGESRGGSVLLVGLTPDGALDPLFGDNGMTRTPLPGAQFGGARDVALQADGKILVAAEYTDDAGNSIFAVARYQAGGTADATFSGDGIASADVGPSNDLATSVVALPDGSVVVGGWSHFATPNGSHAWGLAKFLPGGLPDASFGTGGVKVLPLLGYGGYLGDLVAGDDGAIYGAGSVNLGASTQDMVVARILADGSLDEAWGAGGLATAGFDPGASASAAKLVRQDDGKLLLAGSVNGGPGRDLDVALARFDAIGSRDPFFGQAGRVVTDLRGQANPATDVALGPNGNIVVSGHVGTDVADAFLARYLGDPPPPVTVAGRHVFYNNSLFDGRTPSVTPGDAAAIAPDKQALLPGAAPSSANVTSYSRGLNGVIIDFSGVTQLLGTTDFQFRVRRAGETAWVPAPAPSALQPLPTPLGAKASRYAITWADGEVRNAWLEVTTSAGDRTGLAAADVFVFGNLVGEVGNPGSPYEVTPTDVLATRGALGSSSDLAGRFDFDRDGKVSVFDYALARGALGRSLPVFTAFSVASVRLVGRPALRSTRLAYLLV
jgi:uncharacterized delta-60 repeat protein